jgi:flagellar P-ring protein precursor FlgI
MTRARVLAALVAMALAIPALTPARAQDGARRIADLTVHDGDVPRRLVGYGLVVGLDGSGDRAFGGRTSATPTVRSVINLLRRFNIEIPPDRLRLRNVAAVLVTAEVSPYLRAGGRFEVQVSALGDASSLKGGVLWTTPLVTDPNEPPVATAQGPLYVETTETGRSLLARRGNAGRIPQGGIVEVEPPAVIAGTRLLLRRPDLTTATRIAQAIHAAFGDSAAWVQDPGVVGLRPDSGLANAAVFLAAVDSLVVVAHAPARIVIDSRAGTVVAGGDIRVGPAVVSHNGVTLEVGRAAAGTPEPGTVRVASHVSVQDVAAGLHAAGLGPGDIVAVFEALLAAGALAAEVVIR